MCWNEGRGEIRDSPLLPSPPLGELTLLLWDGFPGSFPLTRTQRQPSYRPVWVGEGGGVRAPRWGETPLNVIFNILNTEEEDGEPGDLHT